MPLVYDELRQLAQRHLRRERAEHTLQRTALVNEAFLRLVKQQDVEWQSRSHFLALASQLMRRILVDHARGQHASKRGSGIKAISMDSTVAVFADNADTEGPRIGRCAGRGGRARGGLTAIDAALTRLEAFDPRQSKLVELALLRRVDDRRDRGRARHLPRPPSSANGRWRGRGCAASSHERASMTPERWSQIKELFYAALDLPPDERPAFLLRECAGDGRCGGTRQAARGARQTRPFLEQSATSLAPGVNDDAPGKPWIGRRIGPYQVVELLGTGGMGEVYKAVRPTSSSARRWRSSWSAAVTTRNRSWSASGRSGRSSRRSVIPNIARLLDGGATEDGLPYLVMELIEGRAH